MDLRQKFPDIDFNLIQLTLPELSVIISEINIRPQCRLLVFGCGYDSILWQKVNSGGVTAFLEDNDAWISISQQQMHIQNVHKVCYGTCVSAWKSLLNEGKKLLLELPREIQNMRWDVVLVDGPAGYNDEQPGRIRSIYIASRLVAKGGVVFVHDCERPLEHHYCERYLGERRRTLTVRGRAMLNGYHFA